jgi:DNA-directed RNA polymerase subunit K/omega
MSSKKKVISVDYKNTEIEDKDKEKEDESEVELDEDTEDINSDDEDEFNYEDDEGDENEEEGENEEDKEDSGEGVDEEEGVDEGVEEKATEEDDDEDDEEDDDDDEDSNINIIDENNDADVETMAIRVDDDERITPAILTKYELSRVLGIRTKQLAEGAKPLISDSHGKSPIRIAIDELFLKKMPFKIKRSMPYPKYEIWKMEELKVELNEDEIEDLINAIQQ